MGDLRKINTLRNQIFIGFMLVMIIVLAAVGFFTYGQVSVMLRQNAEKHIQQTAVQATGKLDVLLRQMDTFTIQVASNATVQRLMTQEAEGKPISFAERQSIQREVRKQEAYMTGIRSVELYANDFRMLMPFTEVSLDNRVPVSWIYLADEQEGRLVWFGMDSRYPNSIVAIRQVRLIDRSYEKAGYVLVLIDKNYFELTDTDGNAVSNTREMMGLFDASNQAINSDFSKEVDVERMLKQGEQTVTLDGEKYKAIEKRSDTTGWSIIILTPLAYAAEGLSVLRTVILVSVLVGSLLFLIFTFILSTMITRPILNLIKAMRNAKLGTLKPIQITSSTMEINELNNTYNQMVDSLNELIEVVYHKELIQSRTELKALQAQINPHFLFNTLEAMNWALEDKGEEELSQVVIAMSGLFRYVISRADEDEWVTVGDELEHAERYLKIMDMRMLSRLSWSIEAQEGSKSVPIPKLLVQPLVENAISHGVEQRVGTGVVTVSVAPSSRPGFTRIAVSDNGPGMTEEKLLALYASLDRGHDPSSSKGTGVGLSNVAKRLKLYYEKIDGPSLDIRSEPGKGTTVAFEIPNEHGEGILR
ncbi:sensor histidine kinase [Paenibacillus sp. NEAU-GSW1]|uniref:sensor histidine kinase n=1 Tax=Paenibacillus sp. NEAU-GSW1 TaxID=2682486 RepID=UPI0012E1D069|nr:sensor histidine kinase [Paenibacillus sp. NEAU-GSW1]MUT68805.1 HAMP domain-containing protein [Paenibacillus sp. NEAU-GSW1]